MIRKYRIPVYCITKGSFRTISLLRYYIEMRCYHCDEKGIGARARAGSESFDILFGTHWRGWQQQSSQSQPPNFRLLLACFLVYVVIDEYFVASGIEPGAAVALRRERSEPELF
jgi:hypothetical protein